MSRFLHYAFARWAQPPCKSSDRAGLTYRSIHLARANHVILIIREYTYCSFIRRLWCKTEIYDIGDPSPSSIDKNYLTTKISLSAAIIIIIILHYNLFFTTDAELYLHLGETIRRSPMKIFTETVQTTRPLLPFSITSRSPM